MRTHLPIDAEARGKLRAWKADVALRYQAIGQFLKASAAVPTAQALALKSGKGRLRAFEKLNRGLTRHGACLEGVQLRGTHPIALWAVLAPASMAYPANRWAMIGCCRCHCAITSNPAICPIYQSTRVRSTSSGENRFTVNVLMPMPPPVGR